MSRNKQNLIVTPENTILNSFSQFIFLIPLLNWPDMSHSMVSVLRYLEIENPIRFLADLSALKLKAG